MADRLLQLIASSSRFFCCLAGLQLFYICRESSGRDDKRLHHQTSQLDAESVPIPPDSEIFKTQDGTAGATVSANGEIDFGNVDLSQMDPEVIRVMFHVNFSAPFDGQPNSTTCLVFAYSGACSSSFIPVPTFRLPPSAFNSARFDCHHSGRTSKSLHAIARPQDENAAQG